MEEKKKGTTLAERLAMYLDPRPATAQLDEDVGIDANVIPASITTAQQFEHHPNLPHRLALRAELPADPKYHGKKVSRSALYRDKQEEEEEEEEESGVEDGEEMGSSSSVGDSAGDEFVEEKEAEQEEEEEAEEESAPKMQDLLMAANTKEADKLQEQLEEQETQENTYQQQLVFITIALETA